MDDKQHGDVINAIVKVLSEDTDVHFDFLERYGLRFRECEGLMQEVLA